MNSIKRLSADIVIIGGGLAGLRAAAAAAEQGCDVLLLTSGPSASPDLSGFTSPINPDDSVELCVKDIESSAMGINNARLAERLSSLAIEEVAYLESLGFPFDMNEDGTYNTIQSLGSSVPRLVHYQSKTGVKAMELTFRRAIEKNARIIGTAMVISILHTEGKASGVLFMDTRTHETSCCVCRAVVVATGGYGAIQEFSTYPANIYGSGYAMAFRAGTDMVDMEFQQFEPCLYVYPPEIKGKVLVTTLIRRGAKLYNGQMHEFMPDYGLSPENAQKGPLARAIYSEIQAGRGTPHGGIYYDVRELPDKLLFVDSSIFTKPAVDAGLDLHRDLPEVAPGGHTSLGGIKVDENCRSSVENIFACGEVIGGVHGANRVGGNAGAETLVFGGIAGKAAAAYAKSAPMPEEEIFKAALLPELEKLRNRLDGISGTEDPEQIYRDILRCMSDRAGILRSEESLVKAREELEQIEKRLGKVSVRGAEQALCLYKCEDILLVGKMAVEASLMRRESRGVFYRTDYPERNDSDWLKNIVIHNQNGKAITEICECIR